MLYQRFSCLSIKYRLTSLRQRLTIQSIIDNKKWLEGEPDKMNKINLQINIKRIFKLNATKYLFVFSCVVNEIRAALVFTVSPLIIRHLSFIHFPTAWNYGVPRPRGNDGGKMENRTSLRFEPRKFGNGSKQFMRDSSNRIDTYFSPSFIPSHTHTHTHAHSFFLILSFVFSPLSNLKV